MPSISKSGRRATTVRGAFTGNASHSHCFCPACPERQEEKDGEVGRSNAVAPDQFQRKLNVMTIDSSNSDRDSVCGRRHACSDDNIIIQQDRTELAETAASMILAASIISIAQRGVFTIALAGGSTPGPVYERLTTLAEIDWPRWRIFWSDERCVSPAHADSNYQMARESLLDRLPQAPGTVSRLRGELPPQEAARVYEQAIRKTVAAPDSNFPRFDLILLGMGDDGHTASLFPGSPALNNTKDLVVADFVSKLTANRLTFTYPLINAARHVLILVSGSSKADALSSALNGPHRPNELPVQGVKPVDGQLRWLVDADAAQSLSQ